MFDKEEVIKDLSEFISNLILDIDWNEYDDEDEYCDLRVQYYENNVCFYWGDPSFDTDHRGIWAHGGFSKDSDPDEIAIELIDQLEDNIYTII